MDVKEFPSEHRLAVFEALSRLIEGSDDFEEVVAILDETGPPVAIPLVWLIERVEKMAARVAAAKSVLPSPLTEKEAHELLVRLLDRVRKENEPADRLDAFFAYLSSLPLPIVAALESLY